MNEKPGLICHRYNFLCSGDSKISGKSSCIKPFAQASSNCSCGVMFFLSQSLSHHCRWAKYVFVISKISCCVEFVFISQNLIHLLDANRRQKETSEIKKIPLKYFFTMCSCV